MSKHDFAELLRVFFSTRVEQDVIPSQDSLAKFVGVSRRTVASWFAGARVPQKADEIVLIAEALGLSQLQTDLLLHSVNPKWVRYGTPVRYLQNLEILRYQEEYRVTTFADTSPPSIPTIETSWPIYFSDQFESNYNHWGLGTKDDGVCSREQYMREGKLFVTMHNRIHLDTFIGSDSACFAPPVYYLSVKAQMLQGETEDEGYSLVFEEVSDYYHGVFRIREKVQEFSVVQTAPYFVQKPGFDIYLARISAKTIKPGKVNKLAILAIHDRHWFYINDEMVGSVLINRLPHSRLDVGVIAGPHRTVCCVFQDFRVKIPPSDIKSD